MVDSSDPSHQGKIGGLYKALNEEYSARWDERRARAIKAESAIPQAERATTAVDFVVPGRYALSIPDDQTERGDLSHRIVEMVSNTWKGILGRDSDVSAFTDCAEASIPATDSPHYANALDTRTRVDNGLILGSVIEGAASLVRFAKCHSVDQTREAAKALTARVVGAKGIPEKLNKVDPQTYLKALGGRIIRVDDQIEEAKMVPVNQAKYTELLAKFEDFADTISEIIDAFSDKVDEFTTAVAGLRHPDFLRVQWFNSLLVNLLKLNPDANDTSAKLMAILNGFNEATDAITFTRVINTINVNVQ